MQKSPCSTCVFHISDEPSTELQVNNNTYHESSSNIMLGQTLHLNCYWLEGYPQDNSIFTFFKDEIILKESPENSLVIEEIAKHDSGEFSCLARNDIGSSNLTKTNIVVFCKCVLTYSIFWAIFLGICSSLLQVIPNK